MKKRSLKIVCIAATVVLCLFTSVWGGPQGQVALKGNGLQVHPQASKKTQKSLEKCQKRCGNDPLCLNECRATFKMKSRTERSKALQPATCQNVPLFRY